jgi:hypothetical protein
MEAGRKQIESMRGDHTALESPRDLREKNDRSASVENAGP